MHPRSVPFSYLMLMAAGVIPRASAEPITYTLTGYIQFTSVQGNGNAAFTWTVHADTDGITQDETGRYLNVATSSSITLQGLVSDLPLANITVLANPSAGRVNFGSTMGNIGLTNDALKGWNMATPLGPLNGPNVLTPGTVTTADGLVVTLTGVAKPAGAPDPSFQAAFPMPVISSVQNAATNILGGPNGGIAQGAIFVIKGSGLGPAELSVAPTAFQTTSLSGTSVAVTVGSATVDALMYYTSDGQVAALLPSNTPPGPGTFTVTFNGKTSAPVNHGIVPNNLGIFTIDSSGTGPGIVTFADYSLVSANKDTPCGGPNTACGAANPGDTLILWATGLGPVNGSDASGAGLGQAMPNIRLTLWLGGVEAPVVYQGRSGCCIGEDQIIFTVPDNVPTGCAVPLLVQIGIEISNSTLLPVARGSRDCTPTEPAFASVNFAHLADTGPVTIGDIGLEKSFNGNGTGFRDTAYFEFNRYTLRPGVAPFVASFIDSIPPGTCIVSNSTVEENETYLVSDASSLDGGSSISVMGPNGNAMVPSGDSAILSETGAFLGPGAYTVTGSGGKDVGSFRATLTIPASAMLTNPMTASNLNVTRSNGMTIDWSGGDPDGTVFLSLTNFINPAHTASATARCKAAASAGTLTIPPYILLAVPTGNSANLIFGSSQAAVGFTATGVQIGNFHASSVGANVVFFGLR